MECQFMFDKTEDFKSCTNTRNPIASITASYSLPLGTRAPHTTTASVPSPRHRSAPARRNGSGGRATGGTARATPTRTWSTAPSASRGRAARRAETERGNFITNLPIYLITNYIYQLIRVALQQHEQQRSREYKNHPSSSVTAAAAASAIAAALTASSSSNSPMPPIKVMHCI